MIKRQRNGCIAPFVQEKLGKPRGTVYPEDAMRRGLAEVGVHEQNAPIAVVCQCGGETGGDSTDTFAAIGTG